MDMLARADRCAGFADMFSVFYDLIALSDITHSKFVINGDILGSCYGMFRPIRGEPGKQRAPGNVFDRDSYVVVFTDDESIQGE